MRDDKQYQNAKRENNIWALLYLFIFWWRAATVCLWEIPNSASQPMSPPPGDIWPFVGVVLLPHGKRTPKTFSGCRPETANVLKWAGSCHGAKHSFLHPIRHHTHPRPFAPQSCRWNPIYNGLNPYAYVLMLHPTSSTCPLWRSTNPFTCWNAHYFFINHYSSIPLTLQLKLCVCRLHNHLYKIYCRTVKWVSHIICDKIHFHLFCLHHLHLLMTWWNWEIICRC